MKDRKAFCLRGHPLTPDNLYQRWCRRCRVERTTKWRSAVRLKKEKQKELLTRQREAFQRPPHQRKTRSVASRTFLSFRKDGKVKKVLHSQLGEGARAQVSDLPADACRRLKKIEQILPSFRSYDPNDPAIYQGRILTFEERLWLEQPPARTLLDDVAATVKSYEEIHQQIALWIMDGTLTWREFKANSVIALQKARAHIFKTGEAYSQYQLSIDAPVSLDSPTTLAELIPTHGWTT